MDEPKLMGVKMIARVAGAGNTVWGGHTANRVEGVAEERMASGGKVNANLVRSARRDGDINQGGGGGALDDGAVAARG